MYAVYTRPAVRRTACESSTTVHMLLVHLSAEAGAGWTTVAIDRASRAWAIAQRDVKVDAASAADDALYGLGEG